MNDRYIQQRDKESHRHGNTEWFNLGFHVPYGNEGSKVDRRADDGH